MALSISQSATAIKTGLNATFVGVGGTAPYTYAVLAGGAGGVIDSIGNYAAPAGIATYSAASSVDTITVTDSSTVPLVSKATILVGSPLLLLCEIIQKQMGLTSGRVYLWDQKLMQPTDSGLYIAVSVSSRKVFANVKSYGPSNTGGLNANQYAAVSATVELDIISRSAQARDRNEEVVLALQSDYSQAQQVANSFYISRNPRTPIINLSELDGAAIPYRFRTSMVMNYAFEKAVDAPYYSQLGTAQVAVDELTSSTDIISGGDITPEQIIISGGSA